MEHLVPLAGGAFWEVTGPLGIGVYMEEVGHSGEVIAEPHSLSCFPGLTRCEQVPSSCCYGCFPKTDSEPSSSLPLTCFLLVPGHNKKKTQAGHGSRPFSLCI